ncbi:MAG TPA: VOC family protein [Jatrophihabitantaceae bacterium]|nr:VOC family protein [Jatrophihabitantaceae bacterium]
MSTVNVRYIVDDVDAAIEFYTNRLGFEVRMHPAPQFAILARDALQLLLSAPSDAAGGGQVTDGGTPTPGGWNRISLVVDDLADQVAALRAAGVRFRTEIINGVGGDQILLEDPSGNPVELFQYRS